MLVLSRKKDESIVLDGQIEIQILKIKGNTVRLGIKAPAHIKVLRGELSPFDVEVEMEQEKGSDDEVQRFANSAPALDTIIQEIELPNPFAVANAG